MDEGLTLALFSDFVARTNLAPETPIYVIVDGKFTIITELNYATSPLGDIIMLIKTESIK